MQRKEYDQRNKTRAKAKSGRVRLERSLEKKWKKTSNSPQLNVDVDFSIHSGITILHLQFTKQLKY